MEKGVHGSNRSTGQCRAGKVTWSFVAGSRVETLMTFLVYKVYDLR